MVSGDPIGRRKTRGERPSIAAADTRAWGAQTVAVAGLTIVLQGGGGLAAAATVAPPPELATGRSPTVPVPAFCWSEIYPRGVDF